MKKPNIRLADDFGEIVQANIIAEQLSKMVFDKKHARFHYYVYVVTDGHATKVGYANDLESRISGMQCGNSREIELVAAYGCESEYEAKKIEYFAHELLVDSRLRGEWFDGDSHEIFATVLVAARVYMAWIINCAIREQDESGNP